MSDDALYTLAMILLIGAVPVGALGATISIWFSGRRDRRITRERADAVRRYRCPR